MTSSTYGVPWDASKPVTYSFVTAASDSSGNNLVNAFMTDDAEQATIRQALARWAAATNLTFSEVPDTSTGSVADIRFGLHQMPASSNVLAYTSAISLTVSTPGTEVGFGTESLTADGVGQLTYFNGQYSLLQVATHEIGHALGLGHSDDPNSIMFAYFSGANTSPNAEDYAAIQKFYGKPEGWTVPAQVEVYVADDKRSYTLDMDTYTGPVNYLTASYIYAGDHSANILATSPSVFIRGGDLDDAIQTTSGHNVVDGGAGSNYLSGTVEGAGTDTFFLDARNASTPTIWDTIAHFHPGDMVTLWGFRPDVSTINWADGEGAVGAKGLTMHSAVGGEAINASLTLAGLNLSDLSKLAVTTGHAQAGDYLAIQFA